MTASLPSGDGTVTDAPTETALDGEASPETGLEPDTAPDAADDPNRSVSADAALGDRTVLDGPALENEEMHRATDDLRSSEAKLADAREIAGDLAAKTQPRAGEH